MDHRKETRSDLRLLSWASNSSSSMTSACY